MKRLAFLFVGLLVGLAAHAAVAVADDAATVGEIKRAAKMLDEAYAKQDVALIKTMVTSDHQAATAYYGRLVTTAEQIATLDKYQARLFDVSPEEVDLLGNDAALVTFEKSYDGTFEGKPLPKRVFVSAVWEKKDGKWLQRLYQETVIEPGQ